MLAVTKSPAFIRAFSIVIQFADLYSWPHCFVWSFYVPGSLLFYVMYIKLLIL